MNLERLLTPQPIKKSGPTPRAVLRAARAYVAHGLSCLPIAVDGTKAPAKEVLPVVNYRDEWYGLGWSPLRERLPRPHELRRWFYLDYSVPSYGLGVIGGAVSGGLEIIDLDNWDVVVPWCEMVEEQAPGLLAKLVLVRTPRPGMHAYYRCSTAGPCEKLACKPVVDPASGKTVPKTLIETKGEGGYCVAPPSLRGVHAAGFYVFMGSKTLTDVSEISAEERDVLLQAARSFNTYSPPELPKPKTAIGARGTSAGGRPGDDFNARAQWSDILEPHGWVLASVDPLGTQHWRRPGKSGGTSATVDYEQHDLLYVFTSAAPPFEQKRAYKKFAAYALLNHGGDYSATAKALCAKGYGDESRVGRARGRRKKLALGREHYASHPRRSDRLRRY